MLKSSHIPFAAVFLGVLTGACSPVAAQFRNIVQHLPRNSNVLVLFNVEAMMRTPLAAKEKWRQSHEQMFSSGMVMVPPQAGQYGMASQLDLELMRPIWNAAVMSLSYEPSMPKAAARFKGQVDVIERKEAAILATDTYVVKFGKALAGIMTPANRQSVGRWVRDVYSSSKRKPLSDYLTEAQGFADNVGTPIIMALDLEHVVSTQFIRDRIESFESLKGHNVDFNKLSETLSSIRGVTLGITIRNEMFGKLKVDFKSDVTMTKDYAKPLLLEILAKRGAMINEFREWKVAVAKNQISIEGNLYESGRRRIASVLDAPPSLHYAQKETRANVGQTQKQQVVLASQQYFKNVSSMIDDLRESRQSDKFVTTGQLGMWYEKYARKIDRLPILNVDPQLLEWGAWVSNQLRQSESAMKGVGARQSMRISQKENAQVYDYRAVAGGGYAYNRWGGYRSGGGYAYQYRQDPRASLRLEGQQRSRIRTQERIRGFTGANTIMQGLDAEMGEIRRQMTQKYGVEF